MEKKITVYVLSLGERQTTFLSKGEAEKAVAILSSLGLTATYAAEKRTATIS